MSTSVLIIGGRGSEDNLPAEVINLDGYCNIWKPEKYPKDIADATGAFINGQVIICGGNKQAKFSNECYTLQKGGSWTLLGNLNEDRAIFSSAVIDNSLFLIGGPGACDSIESITTTGIVKKHEPGILNNCIFMQSSVAINRSTAIIIGGSGDANEFHDKTYYYNGETLSKGPDLITGRYFHAAGLLRDKVTNDEYVAVVGGLDSDSNRLNSLELLKIGNNKWKSGTSIPQLTSISIM